MSTEEKHIRIPAVLYLLLRDAVRAAERDSRRTDRSLHDTTRDLLTKANDGITDWQDRRVTGVKP